MTIYIKGTDNSASAPALAGTDATTGMYFPSSNTIAWAITSAEAMRLDSGGNLGIGMTPTYKLDVTSGNSFSARFQGSEGPPFIIRHLNPAVYIASDTGLYESIGFDPTNHIVNFFTNNTERARIDSSGNLAVGTTTSGTQGDKYITLYGANNPTFSLRNAGSGTGNNTGFDAFLSGGSSETNLYVRGNASMLFGTNNTERARIDSSGSLMWSKTTTSSSSDVGIVFKRTDGSGTTATVSCVGASASTAQSTYEVYSTGAGAYRFFVDYGGNVNATSTSISAISDIRFKENIRDLDTGLDAVMQLRPRLFDWKEGKGANVKNARGFIAQEFEEVFPDLIGVWKDPAPEGEEPYKSVRQDLMPVLVKAIQEQQAIIESLKTRLDAAGL